MGAASDADPPGSPQVAPEGRSRGCPFLERIRYQEGYPVEGYCAALENGQLMIPSIAEYRDLCSSGRHESCRIFRRRAAPERKAA